ncbi:hypothetical protein O181_027573 [Austropuccinia psidii MF-1]|uniref:Reverse transcriptase Ty1/copia-type domain-containing protein n=1 Tax=Austropuccinia psidii MF-1 TaxID=1389203 RepID=A0A9Q3CS27_9BASI|nr:hypothetical protein [Austropuccinia psidii MF-1]
MLGLKIHIRKDGISLDQQHFNKALLEQYGINTCKTVITPLKHNQHLFTATTNEAISLKKLKTSYRNVIGSINYLSTATRPDLLFANRGLYYPIQTSKTVTAFRNTDWGNFRVTRRSTTGYLTCFHQFPVFWNTLKKPYVSISTEEAEYKSLCDLTSEFLWFKQWCEEERLLKLEKTILIYEDNQACIKTADGDCNLNKKRLKHVDIQLQCIKEAIQKYLVCLRYIPSAHMLADFLTK